MEQVQVNVGPRPYDALIGSGLLRHAGEHIVAALERPARVFVITVTPVKRRWSAPLGKSLRAAKLKFDVITMPDGERHKTLASLEKLAAELARRGADRGACVVALGGGVVGDVAGFLGSVYMRGVDVVQAPTTFLAQVDASIGGKTGVNLRAGKNLVGTFHQPRLVIIDPAVLATLPEREYRAGLYEALKCGVIRNPAIFRFMEENREAILGRERQALEWLIAACVRVKAEVVGADERENGLRRILNFGHTLGHALEADTGYRRFLHGEAVAWGMVAACRIAEEMRQISPQQSQRVIDLIRAYAPLPRVTSSASGLLRRLAVDKKTSNGVPRFVLPVDIGEVEIVAGVPESTVRSAVEDVRRLSKT
ncbi:MAG TPA: 3-dehydroquinate synthase [Terriglobales bacterium]|nr:3-dehydroquinate synthase [Terriglobales bacterium]